MKKINLYEMYTFGKAIAPLSAIEPSKKVRNHLFELWDARQKLISMTTDDSPVLSSARRAINRLIGVIDAALPRDITDALNIPDEEEFGWLHGPAVSNGVKELESVLGNDMPDISSYVASQKGIYRTDDLIAHAEQQLSVEVRRVISPQACNDIREAGKCLAYELPTACAFHLWRSVETVMQQYYERLTGKTFDTNGVVRNWGAYIIALKKENAEPKITFFLDHIRAEYRNPQTHPDELVSIEEAQRLFNVALSSIEQMVLTMNKMPSAPTPK